MTAPRRVRKGSTWLITRRSSGRQFLLRPDDFVNQTIMYFLAYTAGKYGIEVHAFQFLSNHYHAVLTDPRGVLPEFLRDFHALIGALLNRHRGRREGFWASARASSVELLDESAVIDKMVYTLTNVVAAGLVHRHEEWPGVTSAVARIEGAEYVVNRPKEGFFSRTRMPDRVRLRIVRPPERAKGSIKRFRLELDALVRERERMIRRQFRSEGRDFLGRARVLQQDPLDVAKSPDETDGPSPEIACKDPTQRKEEIRQLREFRSAYRQARKRFLAGVRRALFPFGTWLLRIRFGARCARAPA